MLVDPDFLDHWRTRLVVDQLGGDELAPLYILRIWAHCQNRKSCSFDGMTCAGLKSLCRFPGDCQKLEAALIEAGFIIRVQSAIEVPKWAVHNASLIATWANGRKGGRPPKNPDETQTKPTGSESETHSEPKHNPDETDKRRQEETRGEPVVSKGNWKHPARAEDPECPECPRMPLVAGDRGDGGSVFLSETEWDRAVLMAEAVARKIPPTNIKGRRCWFKYAALAEKRFSESWLFDAVAGVLEATETKSTKQAHFVGILRRKAKEQYGVDAIDFDLLMQRIEVPKDIWHSDVLQVFGASGRHKEPTHA